jgi:bacterioferritin-associated ferredoxin
MDSRSPVGLGMAASAEGSSIGAVGRWLFFISALARYVSWDKVMIVCSCNVFSDQQLRSTLAKATQRLRMSQIYDCLGSSVQCGRCAHTIKRIMEQVADHAIASVAPSTSAQ